MTSPELLTEAADDADTVVIAGLKDLLSPGSVANERRPGGPLPFYLVNHLDSNESLDESFVEALVSVHVLVHKSAGKVALRDEADRMHRRMLLLGRFLEDVDLAGGRKATIAYIDVAQSPIPVEYGDDTILRKVGRYNIGLPYA